MKSERNTCLILSFRRGLLYNLVFCRPFAVLLPSFCRPFTVLLPSFCRDWLERLIVRVLVESRESRVESRERLFSGLTSGAPDKTNQTSTQRTKDCRIQSGGMNIPNVASLRDAENERPTELKIQRFKIQKLGFLDGMSGFGTIFVVKLKGEQKTAGYNPAE